MAVRRTATTFNVKYLRMACLSYTVLKKIEVWDLLSPVSKCLIVYITLKVFIFIYF